MKAVEVEERTATTLSALLKGGATSMVTLVAGETLVAVHRAVLAARCPVLAALADVGGQVAVADVEGAELLELVAYCYTLQAPQLADAAPRLLAAAHRFGERQLAARLAVDNAAAAAALAVRHSCTRLKEAAIGFLRANLTQVIATPGWADALRLQPAEMAEVSRLLSEHPVGTSDTAGGGGVHAPSAERHSDGDGDGGRAVSTAAPPAAPLRIRKPDSAVVSRLRCLDTKEKTKFLMEAAKKGAVRRLQTLVAAGADVEGTEKGTKKKALHRASERGHVEAVRFLVERGARVDIKDPCGTPLHLAASNGHTEVVRCLIEAQASVHVAPGQWTPLHVAAQNGHAAVVRLLIASSADPNARDRNGRTPLHEAANSGDADTVAALLEAGADRGAMSEDWGETPLDVAVDNNHRHLIEMLL